MSSDASFPARLESLAAHVRCIGSRVARTSWRMHHAPVQLREYREYSLTAAYEAFVALGGDPEHPDEFPWDDRYGELKKAAVRALRRRLRSENENDTDEARRNYPRREVACLDCYRWDAWGDVSEARQRRVCEADDDRPVNHVYQPEVCSDTEPALARLAATVAECLSREDLELVTRHYFQQVPQRVLAAELAVVRGSTPEQAETLVNVRLHRARRKLRRALGDLWREAV